MEMWIPKKSLISGMIFPFSSSSLYHETRADDAAIFWDAQEVDDVVFAIRWLLEVDARELEQANIRARDLIAVVLDALAFITMFRYEEYA